MPKYRETFAPIPDEELSPYAGQTFKVLAVLENDAETPEGELYDMYRIRLACGKIVTAFPEEVREDWDSVIGCPDWGVPNA